MLKKYFIVFLTISVGLVGLIAIYKHVGLREVLNQLHKLHYWQVFIIFIFVLCSFSLTVVRWRMILNDLSPTKISWRTAFKVRLGEFAFSYLMPIVYFSGESARAYILNKEKGVPLNIGLSSSFIDRISELLGAFIFIFFGGLLLIIEKNTLWGILLLVVAFIILLALYLLIGLIGIDKVLNSLVKLCRLDKINYNSTAAGQTTFGERLVFSGEQIMFYLKHYRWKFFLSILLSCLTLIVWLGQTNLLIYFFGFYLTLAKIFIIKCILTISGFIPIPANIGIYEGAHALAFTAFGLPAEVGIALSVVTRAIDLFLVSVGILLISHMLVKFLVNFSRLFKKDYVKSTD